MKSNACGKTACFLLLTAVLLCPLFAMQPAYADGYLALQVGSVDPADADNVALQVESVDPADEDHGDVVATGTAGQNARFTWYSDRTVVVEPVVESSPAYVEPWEDEWVYEVDGEQLSLASDKDAYRAYVASITLSGNFRTLIVADGVKRIADRAFAWHPSLRTVQLPAQMDYLGDMAFAGCSLLYEVDLPETLTVYSGTAALRDTEVHSVVFPLVDDGTGRAANVALGCTVLQSAVFPEGVTTVTDVPSGGCDFGYCIDAASQLRSIEFPSTLSQVKCGMLDPFIYLDTVKFKCDALVLDDYTRNLFSDSFDSKDRTSSLVHYAKVSYPYKSTGFVIADAGGVASSRVRVMLDPKGEVNYRISKLPDPGSITEADSDTVYGAWDAYWKGGFYWKEGVSDDELARLQDAIDALWTAEMQAAWGAGAPGEDADHGAVVSYGLCGQNARFVWYDDGVLVAEPIVPGKTSSVGRMNNENEKWVFVDGGTGTEYRYTNDENQMDFYHYAEHMKNDVPIKSLVACEGITRIEDSAFSYKYQLRRVELPEHMEYLGMVAFEGCSALTDAVLPKTLDVWSSAAFQGTSLRSAELPLILDGSGQAYMPNSPAMQYATFPEGVVSVASPLGFSTSDLRGLVFPSTLGQMKAGMLDSAYNLEWVRFKSDFPALDDMTKDLFTDAFAGHVTVYYPYGARGFSIARAGAVASNVWTDVKLLAVPNYDALPAAGAVTLGDADVIRSAQEFEANACDEARAWATGDSSRLAPAAAALDALELVAAKDAAKAELSGYASPADYREAQRAMLASAVSAGSAAIDSAVDKLGVSTALADAKTAIDAIPTDAQMTAAEQALADAKDAAVSELEGYRDPSLYLPEQQAELADAVAAGTAAIRAAADAAGVSAALAGAKAAIGAIRTAEQVERATNVANSELALSGAAFAYTGKAVRPVVTVRLDGRTLVAGTDYAVSYSSNLSVGTATVTVTGAGAYHGAKSAAFAIVQAANKVTAKKATVKKSFKAKNGKLAKAQSFQLRTAAGVSASFGAPTYAKTKGTAKVVVTKSGKVTLKKGLAKGTYTVKVKASVAKTANWKAASKTITLKLTVK